MSRYSEKYWDASVGIHMPVLDPGELYGCEITDTETGLIGTTHRGRSSKTKAYDDAWSDLMEKQSEYYSESKESVQEKENIPYYTDNTNYANGFGLIKWAVIGGIVILIVVVVLWLAVNVVLPIALLNSALILAILAVIFKKQKTLFAILAILGGVYMMLDITNGWFSLNFVTKVVKNPNWISAFVYINAAAIGFCIWLLIQPIWSNIKITETTNKRKSLLLRSGVVLLSTIITLSIPITYYTIHNPFVSEPFNLKFAHKANLPPITSPNVREQTSKSVLKENINEQNNTGRNTSSIENKGIKSVKIGTQTWMVENLKTTQFNDGIDIPIVTDNVEWSNLNSPGYSWYNNDIGNKDLYGALYNWFTVNTGKLCPVGWHVATNAEWETLITYLGGVTVAGCKLKETGTTFWENPNIGATNESGFTALPGGNRYVAGEFVNIKKFGYWWSANESNSINASARHLFNQKCDVLISGDWGKRTGMSVRCLKDDLPDGSLSSDAKSKKTNTSPASGEVINSIKIGSQIWMSQNLKTNKFNDGTDIPLNSYSNQWIYLSTPGFGWNNFDETSFKDTFGAFYNWYAVNTGKLCPIGWHVPTDSEWTELSLYLGGENVAGDKLKSVSGWNMPSSDATNLSWFTALPGGSAGSFGDAGLTFIEPGTRADFWTSTSYNTDLAWSRSLFNNIGAINRFQCEKSYGCSVRCIKNN